MKKSEYITCPGLFYGTPARDGIISRIRIPGGIINSKQLFAIANLSESVGDGFVQITNHANLQVRAINEISFDVLQPLQAIALAAQNQEIDHLRNIMSSPTAGIDRQQLIDTRPLVKELDKYISSHPHLTGNTGCASDIPALIEQILQNNYQTSNLQYLTLNRHDH
ncbi:MAG: hypothetical protein ACFCU7_18705 [Pleurocapsa sp.]